MRQLSPDSVWLGHVGDLRDVSSIMDAGISAIVELADNEPKAVLPRELIRIRFPISDDGENPLWLIRMVSEMIASLIRNDVSVLICCSAGTSRSVCAAAAGLALSKHRPLSETLLEVVHSGPADVSPGLWSTFQQVFSN